MAWLNDLRAMVPDGVENAIEVLLAGGLAVIAALFVHRVLSRLLRRIAAASSGETDDTIIESLLPPLRWILIAMALVLVARELPSVGAVWERIAGFVVPALVGWMALAVFRAFINAMMLGTDASQPNNLHARSRQTRLSILSRLGTVLIAVLTVSMMLLSIPGVRQIGVTLMASAGLAALAVGAAAQPALKSLIAGIQMALTQPIRIGDIVVLDGETGRVEDIRTTFVIVRLWDERRMVVPTTRFLEDTFQNWTRDGSKITGSVILNLDPLANVGLLRPEFERQVKAHPLWDGRTQRLQVTETAVDTIQVQMLMSAANATASFDLSCAIREGMLAYIRETMPEAIKGHSKKADSSPAPEASEPEPTTSA